MQLQTGLKNFQDVHNSAVRSVSLWLIYLGKSGKQLVLTNIGFSANLFPSFEIQPSEAAMFFNSEHGLRNITQEPLWTTLWFWFGFFSPHTNKSTSSVWHRISLDSQEVASPILGSSLRLFSQAEKMQSPHWLIMSNKKEQGSTFSLWGWSDKETGAQRSHRTSSQLNFENQSSWFLPWCYMAPLFLNYDSTP